jgi:drug/metabolite transporter (DMT)-like permease
VPKKLFPRFSGYLYVATAAIIWGSNGVIVNLVPFDAFAIAFFRVLFGCLTLLPLILIIRRTEMRQAIKSWKIMLSAGFLLALGWVLLFYSMKLIAIANAVLLNYTAPIFVALLAPLFLKEKLEKSTFIALIISIAGIVTIAYQQNLEIGNFNLLGIILGLLAGLGYAGFIMVTKKALYSFSNETVAFYSYSISAIFLIPFITGTDLSAGTVSWILLLVLGIVNTGFAVTVYLKGLGQVKAQKAVVLTYLEPASAMVFGFFFLSQQPTPLMILGGCLILIAGYIVVSK